MQRIDSLAFANCKKLKSVVFEGTPQNLGSAIFECSPVEQIIIPLGTTDYFTKALFELDKNFFHEM